ncbi:MAG TPA: hypothetical protein DCW42_00120 [Bacteroidetes bacterium]|nr:hypothetical protein [Bacteroidota bacterium]
MGLLITRNKMTKQSPRNKMIASLHSNDQNNACNCQKFLNLPLQLQIEYAFSDIFRFISK